MIDMDAWEKHAKFLSNTNDDYLNLRSKILALIAEVRESHRREAKWITEMGLAKAENARLKEKLKVAEDSLNGIKAQAISQQPTTKDKLYFDLADEALEKIRSAERDETPALVAMAKESENEPDITFGIHPKERGEV